ncbi:EF-hand domain-containing protein [Thalassotalea piscium]
MKHFAHAIILATVCLTLSSYANAANQAQGPDNHPPRPTFESIDINGDTDISFDEFLAQEIPRGDHQTIFDLIDTDNNGVISSEEYNNHKPPRPPKNRGNKND